MAVGQHDGDHVVETVANEAPVRQDDVDAWLMLFWEQHAAVDDEQFAVELEDGHVSADFPETTGGDNAEISRSEPGGGGLLRRRGRVFSGARGS